MSNAEVTEAVHVVPTTDGWDLELVRVAQTPTRRRHPLLVVPGYAMNTTALRHHPRGPSLVQSLAQEGYEVWALNLRGAGKSHARVLPPGRISLGSYVDVDLPAALDAVRRRTSAPASGVFCVGTSLGGSVVYGHLACAGSEGIAGVVAVGAPLRWAAVHPMIRALFRSRRLAQWVPMRGVRHAVRLTMPPLARAGVLALYVNRKHLDGAGCEEMVRAVEDPTPHLNEEIAEWMRARDLYLNGINVTRAMATIDLPLLVVHANRDGLVPADAARSAASAWGGADVEVIEVGTPEDWFAHADLFVADEAPTRVFAPIARWLAKRDPA